MFPTRCTSFMIAGRAKNVFQVIVRAWKISHVITMKQSRPIACRYFEKGRSHLMEWDSQGDTGSHLLQQILILSSHLCRGKMVGVRQDMCSPMYPTIACLHIRPQLLRRC